MSVFNKKPIKGRVVENSKGIFNIIQFRLPNGKVQNIPLKEYESGDMLYIDYDHITSICETSEENVYMCENKYTGRIEILDFAY